MVMGSRPSRRRVIAGASAGLVAGVAGCLGGLGGPGPETFPYAEGFGVDGIDLEPALGPESTMATADSLRLAAEQRLDLPFGEFTVEEDGRFDGVAETFLLERFRRDTINARVIHEEQYFDATELFERVKVEPRALSYDHQARSYEFEPTAEYRLDQVWGVLDGVDLAVEEVDRVDGTDLAVYRADPEGFGAGSLFAEWSESFGSVDTGAILARVDDRGRLHDVEANVGFTNSAGEPIAVDTRWRYAGFGETDVTVPDWFEDLPDLELPEVDVTFEETEGLEVVVDVGSMANTDRVAVVVQGEGVLAELEGPGRHVVTRETYTTDEGEVRPVLVFAQNRLRGPVQVGVYQPAPDD